MKLDKYCLQCGETLPDYEPVNKQYCSDACKQRAYRDRLERSDEKEPETVADQEGDDEGGIHPLALLGMLGVGAWLLNTASKSGNKAVTTPPVLPYIPPFKHS